MCDDCKHKDACASIGITPSANAKREACFEPAVNFHLMEVIRSATLAPPATRFASNHQAFTRLN